MLPADDAQATLRELLETHHVHRPLVSDWLTGLVLERKASFDARQHKAKRRVILKGDWHDAYLDDLEGYRNDPEKFLEFPVIYDIEKAMIRVTWKRNLADSHTLSVTPPENELGAYLASQWQKDTPVTATTEQARKALNEARRRAGSSQKLSSDAVSSRWKRLRKVHDVMKKLFINPNERRGHYLLVPGESLIIPPPPDTDLVTA